VLAGAVRTGGVESTMTVVDARAEQPAGFETVTV
jgi:hypothetical protein